MRVDVIAALLLGACSRHEADTVPWRPGDPIPGWEDADCGEETGSYVMDAAYPFQSMTVTFAPGLTLFTPASITGVFADCTRVDCESYNHGGMWLEFALTAGNSTEANTRGQGRYPMAGADPASRAVTSYAATFFGRFFDATQAGWYDADVTACVSHLSPDRVAGFIRWDPWGSPSATAAEPGFHEMIWRQRFNLRIPSPAGSPDGDGTEQGYHSGQPTPANVVFDYSALPYDEAWPWASITDSTLRDHIHDLYQPR